MLLALILRMRRRRTTPRAHRDITHLQSNAPRPGAATAHETSPDFASSRRRDEMTRVEQRLPRGITSCCAAQPGPLGSRYCTATLGHAPQTSSFFSHVLLATSAGPLALFLSLSSSTALPSLSCLALCAPNCIPVPSTPPPRYPSPFSIHRHPRSPSPAAPIPSARQVWGSAHFSNLSPDSPRHSSRCVLTLPVSFPGHCMLDDAPVRARAAFRSLCRRKLQLPHPQPPPSPLRNPALLRGRESPGSSIRRPGNMLTIRSSSLDHPISLFPLHPVICLCFSPPHVARPTHLPPALHIYLQPSTSDCSVCRCSCMAV